MEHRSSDSFPPIPDPLTAPFPSFPMPMPMPEISVQMPDADVPYGQPYASEYGSEASEHLASECPYTPKYPYTPEYLYPLQQSQQPYYLPPHASVPLNHADLPEPWVPNVPEQSDEEEVDPKTRPIDFPTPDHVQARASVSRRPSALQRFASFLGLRHKESTTSRHS